MIVMQWFIGMLNANIFIDKEFTILLLHNCQGWHESEFFLMVEVEKFSSIAIKVVDLWNNNVIFWVIEWYFIDRKAAVSIPLEAYFPQQSLLFNRFNDTILFEIFVNS